MKFFGARRLIALLGLKDPINDLLPAGQGKSTKELPGIRISDCDTRTVAKMEQESISQGERGHNGRRRLHVRLLSFSYRLAKPPASKNLPQIPYFSLSFFLPI